MQNRTDFDLENIAKGLLKYDFLKDKVIKDEDSITIIFQYLTVELSDDYCGYFNTHWHPENNADALKFIDDLMNEQIIFYKNRLFLRNKIYFKNSKLETLLQRKNKKFCKVFSAVKIYIDK